MTLVSKNSCLSLPSSGRVHCFLEVQIWGRRGELNCSPNPRFLRNRGCCDVVGAFDEVRGLDRSGGCVGAEVIAREEESPWAFEGEYGDDCSSSLAVE